MVQKSTGFTVFGYGLILILMGLVGYYKGGSLVSLVVGSGSGALLVICSVLMVCGQRLGSYGALLITLILTGTFSYRYSLAHKPVSAILAVLSGGMLLFLVFRIMKWKKG